MTAVRHAPSAERGLVLSAITNAVVGYHARSYGKGPTRASTRMREGDYVLCMLRDPFTMAERTLIDAGRGPVVSDSRTAFYELAERPLCRAIERLTGHPVVAFVSGIALEQDLITQLFVLDPGRVAG